MSYGSKIIADWLEDATYGVGAVLAALPLGADAVPATPTVYNELEDGWVARAEAPKEIVDAGPCLAVYQTEPQTYTDARPQRMSDTVGAASGSCSYAIAYITRNSATAEGSLAAAHVLRAVRGSLWLLQDETNAASRDRYGFRLETLTAVSQAPMNEERGDSLISGAVTVTWTTRETAPFPT
jgi:hypothetical protein